MIPAVLQNPVDFAQGAGRFPHVLEHVLCYDEVEGVVRKGEPLQVLAADPVRADLAGWHVIEIFGAYIPRQVMQYAVDCAVGLGLVYLELF